MQKRHIQIAAKIYFKELSFLCVASWIGVSEATVRKWSKTKEWKKTINSLENAGGHLTHKWNCNPISENPELFDEARKIYNELMTEGMPIEKIASLTAIAVDIHIVWIRHWMQRYDWIL